MLTVMEGKVPDRVYLKSMPKSIMPLPTTDLSTRQLASTDRRNETKSLRKKFKTRYKLQENTRSPTLVNRHLLPPFDVETYEMQKKKTIPLEMLESGGKSEDRLRTEVIDEVLHRKIIERPLYVSESNVEPSCPKEYMSESPRRGCSVFCQPVVYKPVDENGRKFKQHFVDPEWASERISLKRLQDPAMSDFHKM